MKSLSEHLNDNIRPIFELSDEVLKRAIEKSLQQNTALSRRRAKEFEKYLTDPDRLRRNELSEKTPNQRKFAELLDKYIVTAYDLYNNKKKDDAHYNIISFMRNLARYVDKQLRNLKTLNIKFNVYQYENSYDNYEYIGCGDNHKEYIPQFTKKRNTTDKMFDNPLSFLIEIHTCGEDEKTLNNYGYRPINSLVCVFNFYKDKEHQRNDKNDIEFVAFISNPYHVIPPDYKDDFMKFLDVLGDCIPFENIQDPERIWKGVKGDRELTTKLTGYDLLVNNFRAKTGDEFDNILKDICNILKENDPKCSIKMNGNVKSTSTPSNYYIGVAQQSDSKKTGSAILTYKGKDHILKFNSNHSWLNGKHASISFDDIDGAFYADAEDYMGCWCDSGWCVSKKLKDILN